MSNSAHLLNLFKASYRAKDKDGDRSKDTAIHVSNLINFCPRAYWLCKATNRNFHGFSHPGMQMGWTFDIGHALQRIQVHRLMTQQCVFATWECRHCGYREVGLQQENKLCPKCRCRAWKTRDLGLELALPTKQGPLLVRGNIDYVVATSGTTGFITDAKSIKAEDFDVLTDATIDYKRQVRLYMWLANHKDSILLGVPRPGAEKFKIDPQTAVIAYCVKGARKEPFKIFDVPQDKPWIKLIDAKLQALVKHLDDGICPERICKSQANLMAKMCTARTVCFKGEGR